MKLLFNEDSFSDKGTLYHLKVVLNRKGVTFHNNKIQDFNACEDFVTLVVHSYIVAATIEVLHMSSIDDVPTNPSLFSELDWTESLDIRKDTLYAIAAEVVNKFVDLDLTLNEPQPPASSDKVKQYSQLVLSAGMLFLEYRDAIKEGDGERVLRC